MGEDRSAAPTLDKPLPGQNVAAVTASSSRVEGDANSPIGEWIVESKEEHVQIRQCGDALCGYISSAKNPYATDRYNPDPSRRQRPIIGMRVVIDMTPTKKDRWEGQVYNVKDGKTYSASISLKGRNSLRIEGCAYGWLLCGGQDWIRAEEESN
jgi:uncharacterized protein (DUF2147 family)